MSRVGDSFHRTFHSLHERNFRMYVIGQLVSAAGTWVNATATAWLVLELSGSGIALGLNTALLFSPILVVGPFGGVLADRFDKRRILLVTQSAFAVISLTLWVLTGTGAVHLWSVYALSFLNGIVTAIDNPTRQSFYVEMVGTRNLTNAVSLNSAAFTGARIVGPALAAVLIAATNGVSVCFLIDAVSYVAVIGALLAMSVEQMHRQERTTRERGHLVSGLRYVWATDELRRPLLVMAVVFAFSFNFAVLLPLLARRTFLGGAGTFGALSALAGVGSFLGAIVLANRSAAPTMRRLGAFAIAAGAALVVAGIAPTLHLALVAMIPLGFSAMAFMITGNTILQVNARPQARGRVMALYGVVFLGSTPIGSPIAGWIGQNWGARWGLIVGGAAALSIGLVTLVRSRHERAAAEAAAEEVVEAGAVPASAPA
ncbi:MAG: MFS transporter [Actinomycetota bacterium]|nr:MFS transporter [Actinomycetota bacterium]